jgi:hypothetical protein
MNLKQSKKERAEAVAKAIQETKLKFREIDNRIKETGLKLVTVDVNKLIKSECRKFSIKEKTVREIANWKDLKPGGSMAKMAITTEDKQDAKE